MICQKLLVFTSATYSNMAGNVPSPDHRSVDVFCHHGALGWLVIKQSQRRYHSSHSLQTHTIRQTDTQSRVPTITQVKRHTLTQTEKVPIQNNPSRMDKLAIVKVFRQMMVIHTLYFYPSWECDKCSTLCQYILDNSISCFCYLYDPILVSCSYHELIFVCCAPIDVFGWFRPQMQFWLSTNSIWFHCCVFPWWHCRRKYFTFP